MAEAARSVTDVSFALTRSCRMTLEPMVTSVHSVLRNLLCVWCLVWSMPLGFLPHLALAAEKAEVSYAQGIIAYDSRNYLEALDRFRQTLTFEPDHAEATFYLGVTLSRIGEYVEAIVALERALELDPSMQYVHYRLGITYLQVERYKQALEHFKHAAQFDPLKAETQFYLGKSHYQLQQYDDALPALQQALVLAPDLALSTQYYRGLALYALERDADAQGAFNAAIEANPESAIARNAQRYLEAIKKRLHERRLVQVQAAISYQYDNNVVLEPQDESLTVSGESDSRMTLTLVGQLQPVYTARWQAGAEYALYQSRHFRLDEFDIQSHTAGLFTRAQLGPVALRLAANYNITYLGSTLFTEYNRFSEAFTLYPSAIIRQTKALFVTTSVRYRRSNFVDITPTDVDPDPDVRDRDGWSVRAGFDQYVVFNRQRSYARLSYAYEGSRTKGSDWEFDSHHVGLGLYTPLWGGIMLNTTLDFTPYIYLHVNSFDEVELGVLDADDQDKRRDYRVTTSTALTRSLGRYLTLSLGFEHISNFSNIPFFDYDRNIWTLALSGKI